MRQQLLMAALQLFADDPERHSVHPPKTRVAQSTRAAHASGATAGTTSTAEPSGQGQRKTPRRIRPPHSGRPATRRRMTPRRPHRPGHTFQDEAHPMIIRFA
ncbi:MAG: hypothetical protein ACLSHC_07695 [Bilophila wadsworthia]